MPKYLYACDSCEVWVKEIRNAKNRDLPAECPKCKKHMHRELAKVMEPTIMELRDSRRRVQMRKGHEERVRKRAKDYFIENEMPDLIAEHGEEHAKKVGWIKEDGKVVKKKDMK